MSSVNHSPLRGRPSTNRVLGLVLVLAGALVACGDDTAPVATVGTAANVPTTAPALGNVATARLVFQTDQIMIAGAAGGDSIRPVAPHVASGQEHPDWSPDGRQIVFETDFTQLWAASTTGDEPQLLFDCVAPCAAAYDGAWSPDSTQLAFATAETADGVHTSRASIVILDVATRQAKTVHSDDSGVVWIFQPRWSPDGTEFVFDEATFASNRLDESSIVSERIAITSSSLGEGPTRYLTDPNAGAATAPDWSPTGELVVFVRDSNLVTIRPDGSGESPLTDFDGVSEHAIQPTFLPDGSGIVFTHVTGTFGVDDVPSAAVLALDGSRLEDLPLGRATHVRVDPTSM